MNIVSALDPAEQKRQEERDFDSATASLAKITGLPQTIIVDALELGLKQIRLRNLEMELEAMKAQNVTR